MLRIILLIVFAGLLLAQSAAPPAFEVASIKPNPPPGLSAPLNITPDRFNVMGWSLEVLIEWAYGVRDFQLTGGPNWLKSARFDVQAKAASAVSESQMRLMLQTLLADRCHLELHRATKEFSGYALVAAKNGPKLEPAKQVPGPGNIQIAAGTLWGRAAPMSTLSGALTVLVQRSVVDKTGLDGKYDFKLEFDPSSIRIEDTSSGAAVAPAPETAGSIYTALQEQLGLRLESYKGPIEILVIDRLEKPSEN